MVSYSPSLPLPLSQQLPILPSSLTQPPARSLDLPSHLPQPLLPLSTQSCACSQAQTHNHNPFLWGGSAGGARLVLHSFMLSLTWSRSVLDICVCKDTLAAISPELLKKSKHQHTCTQEHTLWFTGNKYFHSSQLPLHACPLKLIPLERPEYNTIIHSSLRLLPYRQKHEWPPHPPNWPCCAAEMTSPN